MNVSFMGYDEKIATFTAESDVEAGTPVIVSDNGAVSAANGSAFCGICKTVRDGYASVQLGGYVRAAYTDTLTVGYNKLSAESGAVKVDETNGRQLLVVDVDTTDNTAGIIL